MIDKILYSRIDAAEQLSVSLATLDQLIARGDIKTRRMGVRVLIPRTELEKVASRDIIDVWPPKENGKTVRRSSSPR